MNVTTLRVESIDNQNTILMLEEWLEQAKNGELISIGLVGRRTGGEWQTSFSSSPNSLEDAAMLMELAMRRMGFIAQ